MGVQRDGFITASTTGHSGHDGIATVAPSPIASARLDYSSKGGSAAKPPLSRFNAGKIEKRDNRPVPSCPL